MPVPTGGSEGATTQPEVPFIPDDFFEGAPSTSSGPTQSSASQPAQARGAVLPSSEGTDTAGGPEPEGAVDEVPEFDPRFREAFDGLLYLGALTDTFVWAGHKFVIRTLTVNEYLEVGLIHARYKESIGDVRAYTTAMVAAALVSVDGLDIPLPLTNDVRNTMLSYRFSYISEHWYPWVIDIVYDKLQALEGQVDRVLEAMGKASGSTESPPG